MAKTIVGLYNDRTTAERALQDLEQRGFGRDHLRFASKEKGSRHSYEQDADEYRNPDSLTNVGVPKDEAKYYTDGLNDGGSLIIARVHDSNVDEAAEIMSRHNPARYEEASGSYVMAGDSSSGSSRETRTHSQTSERQRGTGGNGEGRTEERYQEVEEDLHVGKRAVARGGVRVHQHVETEREEETLRLRDEKVNVERRKVDRTLDPSEADRAFRDDTTEMVERTEEPVVRKEARVTGEVAVGKETNVREETVGADLRRVRVEVEKLPAEKYERHESDFRQHYEQQYGSSGKDYQDYQDAYRYGVAAHAAYNGRDYREVEPHLRDDYSENYGGRSSWNDVSDAVRRGYESAGR